MAGGKLSARKVETAKPGRHGDGNGLWLVVSPTGRKKWVFRFSFDGRVTEHGLGAADLVSLSEARDAALEARKLLARGINPIREKRRIADGMAARRTFGQCADALFQTKQREWRSARHRDEWRDTLERVCEPIRGLPVDEVGTEQILAILRPFGERAPASAFRARGRIEAVLDYARALGHIAPGEPNAARWRGHMSILMPKRKKTEKTNYAAMSYVKVPEFVAFLREREAISSLALEFCIVTAARSGEVLGARWSEIDFGAKLWIIPKERTKQGREHAVPLSARAVEILRQLCEARVSEFVFPGRKSGMPLSHNAMIRVLERENIPATVHGFRSAFRDWAGNETHYPREIAEAALAHQVGDEVERAYRRGDALLKRRGLMDAWAAYCEPGTVDKVVTFHRLDRST